MKGKYREAESVNEVESILKEAVANDSVVWQNLDGKRVVYEITSLEFIEESRETKLRLNNYKGDFDPDELVYLKLNYRGTMLKSTILDQRGSYITISNPSTQAVKTIELRSEQRIPLDIEEEKLITLTITRGELAQKEHVLRFQVVDISESGICLLVSNQNKKFMEESSEVYITHLGPNKLEEPIAVSRLYIKDFRFKKLGKNVFSNRVGFKLSEKFCPEELHDFLKNRA